MNKVLGALSLCKKAGVLVTGFSAVQDSAAAGLAKLIVFTQDLSPNTRKRVLHHKPPEIPHRDLPLTQADLLSITYKAVGVLAIENKDLAALCLKVLEDTNQGQTHKEEQV